MGVQTTPDVPVDTTDVIDLSGLDPNVFVNANTVTKWLMSQPEESRVGTARALFEKLICDASNSRQCHGNGHDCVKLCSFVQQCTKSSDQALKGWAFTEPLSKRLFHFYLEWYEHDPHRALRLILDVLVTSCTANPIPESGKQIKDHILATLVAIVARTSTTQLTKSGLQCLDHFLSKQAITLGEVKLKYSETKTVLHSDQDYQIWRSFVFDLFSWMELSHVSPLAGKCIVHVFRGLENASMGSTAEGSSGFIAKVGQSWLHDILEQNPNLLDDIKNYVLVPIFKQDKVAALRLLAAFNRQGSLSVIDKELTDQNLLLQLAALELGKKSGLVEEPSHDSITSGGQNSEHVVLRGDALSSFLAHPSLSVRASAFSLLVSSQATTKPFSRVAFDLLKKHLPAFHADYDAKLRNEVLGLTKSLIRRVKNVITVSQRSLSGFIARATQTSSAKADQPAPKRKLGPEAALKDEAEAKEVLDSHEAFLSWYISFLKSELLPTVSYQRHITALRAALLALKIGKHAGAIGDFFDLEIAEMISSDYTWIRLLLDLLMDPFDDVREFASTLLSLFPQEIVNAPTKSANYPAPLLQILQQFCARAQALADRTGRADHGDGAARSQGLLCGWLHDKDRQIGLVSSILDGLEDKIAKAESDLGHAVVENPVHPDFAALSYAWPVLARATYTDSELGSINGIHSRIFACSQRIWLAVKHVLCDDSPEGHLPEEMEDIDGLDTKDLLSYSFRAVHESSNLLRLIVGTLRQTPGAGVPFPPLDVFKNAGNLTFKQLSSLRHRGAFSTVSLTFTTCCQLTQNLRHVYPDTAGSDNLLREWYQGTLNCIMTQASTTRRSAGIPSLIAAVLSANAQSPSFKEVFGTLEEIARKEVTMAETDGSNLPQVHALNSLREIFRSSMLSKKAEGFLASTLQLAANSLKSEVWAIRNCGLLLLRSLIDSLLGTGESKAVIESGWDGVSIRISYNKYPTLPGVILGLLRSAGDIFTETPNSAAAEAVFPALDIIRRAGPPKEHREELWGHIAGYLGSRIWHVREIAARTLCSFLLEGEYLSHIRQLLEGADSDANRLHGVLLTTRFAIERIANLGGDIDGEGVGLFLSDKVAHLPAFKTCPVVQAAYLEVLNLLLTLRAVRLSPIDKILSPEEEGAEKDVRPRAAALLNMEKGIRVVHDTADECAQSGSTDFTVMQDALLDILTVDANTACRMLEAMPKVWDSVQRKAIADLSRDDNVTPALCSLYIEICHRPAAPEARAQALLNLGSLMDIILSNKLRCPEETLPSVEQLDKVWLSLQRKGEIINPTLACAIIKTSGPLMAAALCREDKGLNIEQRLRNWGVLIADSLGVDNTFDTRIAAVTGLKSFFLGAHQRATPAWNSPRYLPIFSALYDSLIDDDDEIREVAASAAAALTGKYMVALEAADHLVAWLSERFDNDKEFNLHVISRMTGQPLTPPLLLSSEKLALAPASTQLQKAMDFDDSLFAAEEQNLFIDEIRESLRWRSDAFFTRRHVTGDGESSLEEALTEWTKEGLEYMLQLAREQKDGDGPLGWTSDQHVFAVCARVVLCAGAIAKGGKGEEVWDLLESFRVTGGEKRVHGSLLEMASIV